MASEPKYFRPAAAVTKCRKDADEFPPPRTVRPPKKISLQPTTPAAAAAVAVRTQRPEPNGNGSKGSGHQNGSLPSGVPKNAQTSLPNGHPESSETSSSSSRFILLSSCVRRKLLDFVHLSRFSHRSQCWNTYLPNAHFIFADFLIFFTHFIFFRCKYFCFR